VYTFYVDEVLWVIYINLYTGQALQSDVAIGPHHLNTPPPQTALNAIQSWYLLCNPQAYTAISKFDIPYKVKCENDCRASVL
jgi:hypothetical protein